MNKGYYIPEGKKLRIAISGKSGCGNTTVSRIIAESLDISFINYTFRTLATENNIPLSQILEEAKTNTKWDTLVDSRQVELAKENSCVLGSRLAIWLLKDADLKIFLNASQETRVKRILNREGGSYDEIFSFTTMRDFEDARRYKDLYNIDTADYSFADIIIDTEKHGAEQIADKILEHLILEGLIARE